MDELGETLAYLAIYNGQLLARGTAKSVLEALGDALTIAEKGKLVSKLKELVENTIYRWVGPYADELNALDNLKPSRNILRGANGGNDFFTVIDSLRREAWIKFLKSKGIKFEIGTDKARKLLERHNCAGMVCEIKNKKGKWELTVVMYGNPSVGTFLEECYHAVQRGINKIEQFREVVHDGVLYKNIDYWEYQAKMKIVQKQKTNGVCAEEIEKMKNDIIKVLNNDYP